MNSNEKDCSGTLFLTSLILAVSIPISIIVGNRFYPRYRWDHDPIFQTGSLEQYQQSATQYGLYYYVPIFSIIESTIALIIGPSQAVSLIFSSSVLIGVMAGLFALLRRLDRKLLTGIIGAFFLISIPSLSFTGRMFPLLYAILYILLILLRYESPRASVVSLWIVALPMIFVHPSGFVAIVALLLPLALLGINNWPSKGWNTRKITLSIISTIFVAMSHDITIQDTKSLPMLGRFQPPYQQRC